MCILAALAALPALAAPPQAKLELVATQTTLGAAFGGAIGVGASTHLTTSGSEVSVRTIVVGAGVGAGLAGIAALSAPEVTIGQARGLWLGELTGLWLSSCATWTFQAPGLDEPERVPLGILWAPGLVVAALGGGVGFTLGDRADPRVLDLAATGLIWGTILGGEASQAEAAHRRMPYRHPAWLFGGGAVGLAAGAAAATWTEVRYLTPLVSVGGLTGTVVAVVLSSDVPTGSARLGTLPVLGTSIGMGVGAGAALLATQLGGDGNTSSMTLLPTPDGAVASLRVVLP